MLDPENSGVASEDWMRALSKMGSEVARKFDSVSGGLLWLCVRFVTVCFLRLYLWRPAAAAAGTGDEGARGIAFGGGRGERVRFGRAPLRNKLQLLGLPVWCKVCHPLPLELSALNKRRAESRRRRGEPTCVR